MRGDRLLSDGWIDICDNRQRHLETFGKGINLDPQAVGPRRQDETLFGKAPEVEPQTRKWLGFFKQLRVADCCLREESRDIAYS